MWFDKLSGIRLSKANAKKVAEWIRGERHVVQEKGKDLVFVVANTPRGDVMIREGDWIAKDMDERFRIVRIEEMNLDEVVKRTQSKRNVLHISAKNYSLPVS